MDKLSKFVVKNKILILIVTALLLIPAVFGMIKTKINYDVLLYLPEDIETVKGQNILTDDFNIGAFSITILENMPDKQIRSLENDIRKVDSVNKVVNIVDLKGTTFPLEILSEDIISKVAKDDTSLLLITFDNSTSDEKTLKAVEDIKEITKNKATVGGMSSMVLDTKELSDREMPLYVVIAVILCVTVLMLSLDSYAVPFVLLANIGIAILFNMGTNAFFDNISYITKAISTILQLGVTMDFSIFLYHKYEKYKETNKDKEKAMQKAIKETLVSVLGSSLTTMAGFLALCTMSLTLGKDIGIVMAKGVLFGLICVIFVFPDLLLIFDNLITKTSHKIVLPKFKKVTDFVTNHYKTIFVIFILLLVPAYFMQKNTNVYYKLDKSIPESYESKKANKILKDKYNLVTQDLILIDSKLENYKVNKIVDELEEIEGIDAVISPSMISKYGITEEIIPDNIKSIYENDKYKIMIVNSNYEIASNKLNKQIDEVNKVVKKYDKNAIIAGEGPLMKDLVSVADTDFKNVTYTSVGVIFIIMLFVLKSISLPVLLVTAIEFAIFLNMGIPYLTGAEIPFIASIVIGTIQLGATIDYAILLTTKYIEERKTGKEKEKAVKTALEESTSSIFVSAMCFFAATIGVGIISKIDMIGTLCTLIARGAIISMLVVIIVIPSLLIIFDKIICKSTLSLREVK